MMIGEICAHIKNYFCFYTKDLHIGDFAIVGGQLSPAVDLSQTDYFRIVGSHRNDGVHRTGDVLTDEATFHGAVWIMSPPADFLALVAEIEAWQAQYGGATAPAMSPFTSESFGGYSYTKASGRTSTAGNGSTNSGSWQAAFSSRLNPYRRIHLP